MRIRPSGRWRALVFAALGLVAAGCGGGKSSPADVPAEAVRLDLSLDWIPSSAADVGLDERVLASGIRQAEGVPRLRALLVARRGRLVSERYFDGSNTSTLFDLRSVTKSVVSALCGIAIQERVLPSAEASIDGYLSTAYVLDAGDRSVGLRHLLAMSSGFDWNETGGNDYNQWITSNDHVQYLLDRPQGASPGARFTYNSAAVHVLGVALQRASGTTLPRYADEHLFRKLGAGSVAWETLDRGTVNGGAGIKLHARDALKFGQLYLQRGWSGSTSVVPESWVSETTAPQYTWRQTYGPQRSVTYGQLWWVSDAQPAAFYAWGYGGQFVYVVPSLELVVFTATDWSNLAQGQAETLANQVMAVILDGVVAAAK